MISTYLEAVAHAVSNPGPLDVTTGGMSNRRRKRMAGWMRAAERLGAVACGADGWHATEEGRQRLDRAQRRAREREESIAESMSDYF